MKKKSREDIKNIINEEIKDIKLSLLKADLEFNVSEQKTIFKIRQDQPDINELDQLVINLRNRGLTAYRLESKHEVSVEKKISYYPKLEKIWFEVKCSTDGFRESKMVLLDPHDFSFSSDSCETCGSHASLEVDYKCPFCDKLHILQLQGW